MLQKSAVKMFRLRLRSFISGIQNNTAHFWKACSTPPESGTTDATRKFSWKGLTPGSKQSLAWCYLSGQHAEEDEDEHALEGVADGEQVGGEGGLMEDVQHSQGPGGSQHEEQGHSTAGARPAGRPETAR